MTGTALRRIPRGALICGLVACLNAACWSFVTAPFQVPDEPDHYVYVKQLFETRTLPKLSTELTSSEVIDVLLGLHYPEIREQPENHTISSSFEEHELQRDIEASKREADVGSPAAGVATSQPPLYYALESIPYGLGKGGTVLDRLQLMRLTSALFAGLTAMFAFLFIREVLPGERWAWIVGGLSIALAPLLGFMSGAVNPDAMLFAVSAALFYLLARAFRRGLDVRTAAAIGTVIAIGFLTKLNFIGLAPGALLGLVVLSVRAARQMGRGAYRLLALAVGIAMSPVVLYVGVNAITGHRSLGIVSSALHLTHGSILAQANYIWQLYLPRLPGTANDFPGLFTPQQLWFRGYVGLYGWLDTPFPGWVSAAALIPAGVLALLCARSLLQRRAALRRRAAELVVYATIAIGLMVLVGADSYLAFPRLIAEYAQVRYLLPLLPLLGAALALAARGAGRRLGPATGVLIVLLFLAHDIFSQLLVVARYYG
jgi:4-amino-4-deoxy-L-arabinose transferase-like glycosyltransferase